MSERGWPSDEGWEKNGLPSDCGVLGILRDPTGDLGRSRGLRSASFKGFEVLSGYEFVWVFASLLIPLVAIYVVVRLAVKHELMADRRRAESRPDPASQPVGDGERERGRTPRGNERPALTSSA